jgi:hypothetical protein
MATDNVSSSNWKFSFLVNAGHCDGSMKEQLVPEALEYVWKGYLQVLAA